MVRGRTGQRVALYVRGTILGYKRSRQIQVNTREDVFWYSGKMMAYVYKAKTKATTPTTAASGARSPAPTETLAPSAQVHPCRGLGN